MAGENFNQPFERGDQQPDKTPEARFENAEYQISDGNAFKARSAADTVVYAQQGILAPGEASKDSVTFLAWKSSYETATIEQAVREGRMPDTTHFQTDNNGNGDARMINIGGKTYNAEDVSAKGDTSKELTQLRADIQENIERITDSNAPLGNKMIGVAKELGRDPERWRSSTTGKCNQFVGEVIEEATGSKPWKGNTPDCHGLNTALAASPDWEVAWTSAGKTPDQALREFQRYKPHDGEVVIWDNSERQHSGILDADRQMHYAGSRVSPTGYATTDIKNYTGTPDRPMDYGAPTVIYRHKNSDQWTK